MMRYAGQVVAVTGGGSGIGAECCRRLAREGAAVAVIDIAAEAAAAVVSELEQAGARAVALVADVRSPEAIAGAIDAAVSALGPLGVAVNCAGIGGGTDLVEDDLALWQRLIDINLSGVYYGMLAQRRQFRASGGGVIVNIASILGQVGYAGAGGYAAAKHGVVGLTRSAALTWASEGVRVNVVCPGFVRTPLMADATEEQWAEIEARHPLGRLPRVEDIAAAVAYLGSSEAGAVTGSVHMVDAGYTAG